ncbi:MAG: hypothetical protein J6J86_07115 [Lachnospiraceae bacterium]|nr:hypothetical protein [Lachnospiraceae bacterium]
MVKRWKAGVCIFVMSVLLTACGEKELTVDTNTLYIKSDGTLTEVSFELFQEEYYDAAELEKYVKDEVHTYNYKNVREAIAVDKVEVQDNVAAAYLTYQTVDDYIAFNEAEVFSGTVKKAMDEGYDFEVEFLECSKGEPAGILDVTAESSNKILILDATIDVRVDGTICFISSNVQKKDKKNVSLTQGELSYIIYK